MKKEEMRDLFLVIDGNSIFYRAYYAYPPTLTTASGKQINAVYGFFSMFIQVLLKYKPRYIALTFDKDRNTFRKKKVNSYKENRAEVDGMLIDQFKVLLEVLDQANWKYYRKSGFEADDFVGTFAKNFHKKNYKWNHNQPEKMVVLTGDKDIKQVITENVDLVYVTGTFRNQKYYTSEVFQTEYNFKPELFDDFLAICGDTSDNIVGVKGIGKVGAQKLICEFGSVEEIYKNIGKVGDKYPRYAKLLNESKELAKESKFLTTLRVDLEINLEGEEYSIKKIDFNSLMMSFKSLGFVSLMHNLEKVSPGEIDVEKASQIDWMKTAEKYVCTSNACEFDNSEIFLYKVQSHTLEKKNLFNNDKFWSRYYCCNNNNIFSVSDLDLSEIRSHKIVVFDLKEFSGELCGEYSQRLDIFDIVLGAYLINSGRKDYSLKVLCNELLSSTLPKDIDNLSVISTLPTKDRDDALRMYFAVIIMIYHKLKELMDFKVEYMLPALWDQVEEKFLQEKITFFSSSSDLELLLKNIEVPTLEILTKMEQFGVHIDVQKLRKMCERLKGTLGEIESRAYKLVGHGFNISSPKQVSQLLYGELNIDSNTKSTKEAILREIESYHPVIPVILEHRRISKLYSTYVKGFEKYIDTHKQINTIHTDYRQTSTVTGRLSSANPNLQNLPIKSKEGKEFRNVFIPRTGNKLYSFDYSQFELRLLAHFSKDKDLILDFKNNKDIHVRTAAFMFDIPESEVNSSKRRVGKIINFGIMYGLSSYGLARSLGIDVKLAKEYLEKYFKRYNLVKKFLNKVIEFTKENEYVSTMFGRIRRLSHINSNNSKIINSATREAINMPAQGTQADLIKLAMIYVDNLIESKYKGKMHLVLQIHDELVIEISEKLGENVRNEIVDIMENVISLDVPLKVDCTIWNSKE